jgi:hypothetical protein
MTEQNIEKYLQIIMQTGDFASSLLDVDIKSDKKEDLKAMGKKLFEFQQEWGKTNIEEKMYDNLFAPEKTRDKIFLSKKIDLNLMKRMALRIDNGHSAIRGLYSIKDFVTLYEKKYRQNFSENPKVVATHLDEVLDKVKENRMLALNLEELLDYEIKIVSNDIEKYKVQLENANLYFQNFMVSRAVKVAYASLIASGFAFILTIVGLLLQSLNII